MKSSNPKIEKPKNLQKDAKNLSSQKLDIDD